MRIERQREEERKKLDAELALDLLPWEHRLEVFKKYCVHCGDKDPRCQCWNDE